MVFEHSSYRSYLKAVLADRKSRNGAYSLRAMARDLELKAPHLSALIKGRNGLSAQSALRIAEILRLSREESDYFCLLVEFERAKTPQLKDSLLQRMHAIHGAPKAQDLNIDLFKMIADWYHIPILEMTAMAGFEFNAANIAARLGISKLEAEVAIERLERLELLEKDKKGRYRKVVANYVFKSAKPNGALRKFHKQMITKAAESLETQAPKNRYVGSQTFAINPAQLPDAAKIIEDCRKKLVELFDSASASKRTQTYHLGIQLFNLTDKGEKK